MSDYQFEPLSTNEQRQRWANISLGLRDLALHDATVMASLRMYIRGEIEYTVMLEALAIVQARDKAAVIEQLTRVTRYSNTPAPIMLPHGARLLGQDGDTERPISMPKLQKGSKVGLNDFGTASGTYVVTRATGDTITLEREHE